MSNTQYARPDVLRLDAAERHDLFLAVATRIELLTCGPTWPEEGETAHVRRLRSLLERLSD